MSWTSTLRIAGLAIGCTLGLPMTGLADEETLRSKYYSLPVIETLSCRGNGCDLSDAILGEDSPYDFGGWAQMGYTTDSTGLFNKHQNEFNLHQGWLYFEKQVDGSDGFDFGGRIDAMYGRDAADTQSFGNEFGKYDYSNSFNHGNFGFAIPQLYAEAAYKDVSVKAGHFYTLLGYESVMAPNNFFFSHAFTMYLSEAFTHTGALATYSGIDDLTLYGGYVLGWDSGFDQYRSGSAFLGGASYTPIEEVTATYALTAGNLGWIGRGYTHSIVIDTTPFENFNYVLQSDYVEVDQPDYSTIGINQYLLYHFFDELGVGTRLEWWKAQGTSYYAVTGGLNIKPLPNLIIRPEGRFQWSPSGDDGRNPIGLPVDEQGLFGIDVILTF